MPQNFPKKEIEGLLAEQSNSILRAVDIKFARLEVRLNREHEEVMRSIEKLTSSLDNFLKRLTDYEDKYESLRLRVNKMSAFLKEKFGVEIAT